MIVHLHGSHILWLLETLRKKYSLCPILYLYSTTWPVPNISCTNAVISHFWQDYWDKHYTLLGNCPPTPPLSQHVALSEKYVLLLAFGRGRWAVFQKRMMILMGSITLTYPLSAMTVVRVLRRELELVYSRGSHKGNNNICMWNKTLKETLKSQYYKQI